MCHEVDQNFRGVQGLHRRKSSSLCRCDGITRLNPCGMLAGVQQVWRVGVAPDTRPLHDMALHGGAAGQK
eukprot:357832-Chlamydomonas_euryale.AAC.5